MSLNCPEHLKYAASHEWLEMQEQHAIIGITDHAQSLLGDIVFLELPKIGSQVQAGQACAVVESVKAASDIYAPIAGEVVEINQAVLSSPEALNENAYGSWLFKIKPANIADVEANVNALLDALSYAKSIGA